MEIQPSQAQLDRTNRAQKALENGQFQIALMHPGAWSVQNGDKYPYTVTQQERSWTCTCPDYGRHGPDINCKHIEAVRLSTAAHPNPQVIQEEKHSMTDTQPILEALRQPLDMSRVKRRRAPGGSVPYLEGYDVIENANRIFDFHWSFNLLGEPKVLRWQKQAMTYDQKLRKKVPLLQEGQPVMEEVGMVYITGKVTIHLGGEQFEHADIGRCVFSGDTPEALDMALAGCATDCLKRCFRQLGDQFGNSLYDKETAKSAGLQNNTSQKPRQKPAQSKPSRAYGDGTHVNGNPAEQKAFDQYLNAHQGKVPASKEALRTWSKAQSKATETRLLTELGYAA